MTESWFTSEYVVTLRRLLENSPYKQIKIQSILFKHVVDEIERLQKENDRLKSDAEQNELILLALHEALKEKQARVQELEQEQRWIPVNKKPKNHGWHFVLYNDKINWDRGYVGVNFYYLDKEEWSNNEDIEFYCEFQPPLFQSPQEEE